MAMRNLNEAFGLFAVLCTLLNASCSPVEMATEPEEFPVHEVSDTTDVGCLGRYPESRIVRGPEVTSPDGRFTAWAEIEIDSRLEADPDAWPPCLHASSVYLTGPGDAESTESDAAQVVHLHLPNDQASGNTVWIVDWSADSRYLLFGDAEWQYEADYSGRLYWIYDTQSRMRRPVSHEPSLIGHFAGDCAIHAGVIGFAEDNRLVVAVLPGAELDFEELLEEEPAESACVGRETRLLFDPATSKLEPLPATATVERHGRWE